MTATRIPTDKTVQQEQTATELFYARPNAEKLAGAIEDGTLPYIVRDVLGGCKKCADEPGYCDACITNQIRMLNSIAYYADMMEEDYDGCTHCREIALAQSKEAAK